MTCPLYVPDGFPLIRSSHFVNDLGILVMRNCRFCWVRVHLTPDEKWLQDYMSTYNPNKLYHLNTLFGLGNVKVKLLHCWDYFIDSFI